MRPATLRAQLEHPCPPGVAACMPNRCGDAAQRPRPLPALARQRPQRGASLAARVTNEGREMRVDLPNRPAAEADDDYMIVDPENTFWNRPELGRLEESVSMTFEEGLFEEEVDPVAMEYWFTEPPGGWQTEPRRMRKVKPSTWLFDSLANPGPGRLPLGEVQEGQVFQGMVTQTMLYHGAQIDIGAEFDGLLPICEIEQWEPVEGDVDVGTAIEVRVHRIRDPSLFRFPIQLVPTDPALAAKLPDPDTWEAPMDLRNTKLSLAELQQVSGRDWEPKKVVLQYQDDLYRFNTMREPVEEVWDLVSDQQLDAIESITTALIEGRNAL